MEKIIPIRLFRYNGPNKTMRKTRHFIFRGEQLTIKEIAKKCRMSPHTIRGRIARGWSIEVAVSRDIVKGRGQFGSPSIPTKNN